MSVAGILFLVFIILLLNVPIALGLGLASIVPMVTGTTLEMLPMQIYAATGKFTLLAIPFYTGRKYNGESRNIG